MSPLLIVGTHRSGASLIARLLEDLGLFIGHEVDEGHRATFFARRNEAVLQSCHGGWDTPHVLRTLLTQPRALERVAEALADDLASSSVLPFLGFRRFVTHRSALALDEPWGFWDPLSTVLLPLWLRVFPDATVLHVYRNGVDVARLLAHHEAGRLAGNGDAADEDDDANRLDATPRRDALVSLVRSLRRLRPPADRLARYAPLGVRRCLEMHEGYTLWTHYIASAFEHTRDRPSSVQHLRFEDFLANPDQHLEGLARHARLRPAASALAHLAGAIDRRERFGFIRDPNARELYRLVRHSPWMRRLGYHELVL